MPEGDDHPEKYTLLFILAKEMVLNNVGWLPFVDGNIAVATRFARQLNAELGVLPVSCRTGEGLEAWYSWLRSARLAKKEGTFRLPPE